MQLFPWGFQPLKHNWIQAIRKPISWNELEQKQPPPAQTIPLLKHLMHQQSRIWQWKHIKPSASTSCLLLSVPPVHFCFLCDSFMWTSSSLSLSLSLYSSPSLAFPLIFSLWLTAQIRGHDLYLRSWLWLVRPWALKLRGSHRYP